MGHSIQTFIPSNLPKPLGPYSHIAKAGQLITISAIAGMDPGTGKLFGPDAYSQTKQILTLLEAMLVTVGSDFLHVLHVNVYLKNMEHLDEVSRAYDETVGPDGPAGTVVAVPDLPKAGALVTMSLIAINREAS
jgi:2-iminobutanoate/2-iminopropanoate deaminase